jgi:hypothetical protein
MTIQVYTFNEQEEKALLAFLESGRYNYKSTSVDELSESEFLNQYNNDLDEAEAQINSGDFISHQDVKDFFANKKRDSGGN